ncbi:hypothetical protein U6B65_13240 [Oscillospiraceae bacterium MB08-C2-2]|nr:hypothetical protein U6B65_13240 [Oscillospiraceae bacterium MB08-C2-2]
MDDLSAALGSILSDPQSVAQLQAMAASLGLGNTASGGESTNNSPPPPAQPPKAQTPDLSGLLSMLGGGGNSTGTGFDVSKLTASLNNQATQNSASGLSLLASMLGGNNQRAPALPPAPANNNAPDLSGLLAQLAGGQPGASQNKGTPDLSGLASMLSGGGQGGGTPDLSGLASMLGGGNQGGGTPNLSGLASMLGGSGQGGAAPDLSGLASMLSGGGQGGGTPNLAGLASMLGGGQGGGNSQAPASGGGLDLSALTGLLNQSSPSNGQSSGSGGGGLDLNMLMMIQKAMSAFTAGNQNVEFMRALKPHLKTERAKKVDDAVRVLQLLQFYPLIKESGLFGDGSGGLFGDGSGGLLGGLFGGGGNVLTNLLGKFNPFGGERR